MFSGKIFTEKKEKRKEERERVKKAKTKRNELRIRGIEPRSVPWEGTMIPLH